MLHFTTCHSPNCALETQPARQQSPAASQMLFVVLTAKMFLQTTGLMENSFPRRMQFSSREKDESYKKLLSCHAVIGLRFYSPGLIPKGLRGTLRSFSNGLTNFHGYISTPTTVLPFWCRHIKGIGVLQRCSAHPVPSPELQGFTVPLYMYFLAHHFGLTSSNTRQDQ